MAAPFGNKFALGNTGGRPPKYESSDELVDSISEYFDIVDTEVPTITGLALYLGFDSRQSFYDYEKNDEFSYIIKRARMVIENCYEMALGGKNPTGAIFALKNMGWIDKVDHNVKSTNLNADLSTIDPKEIKAYKDALEKEF